MNSLLRPGIVLRLFSLNRPFYSSPVLKSSVLDVNTKLAKDVVMFKYENPKFFRVLNTFGLVQFGLMIYMANFVFVSLRNAPVIERTDEERVAWWRKVNLGEEKYRKSFASICAIMGYLVLCGSWIFTLRSVRFLVLRKGGDSVSFVTYGPFGKNRIITVPLNKVSSMDSRLKAKVQLPVKVKGHFFHYMLDMKGEFTRRDLFDATVGLSRNLK